MSKKITLKRLNRLFKKAEEIGKLDEFSDKFWEAYSRNNQISLTEAKKILESL